MCVFYCFLLSFRSILIHLCFLANQMTIFLFFHRITLGRHVYFILVWFFVYFSVCYFFEKVNENDFEDKKNMIFD